MPTLYLHIGMPKTGTTALQSFLMQNREGIYTSINLYYPLSGIPDEPSRSLLEKMHRNLFPIKKTNTTWECLQNEVQSYRNSDILLSEENISLHHSLYIDKKDFEFIKTVFPKYTIKILLYIRRFDEYVKSRYGEELRALPLLSFSTYFSSLYKKKSYLLFTSKLIEYCINLVGEENLILRSYDNIKLHGKDIILDFFEALECSFPFPYTEKIDIYPSLPAKSLPFLSSAFLPPAMNNSTRKLIKNKVYTAFTFPKNIEANEEQLQEFESEILKIDHYLPGYKTLFDKKPCSFAFSEADGDPQYLLLTSLLYTALEKIDLLEEGIAALTVKFNERKI